MDTFSPILDDRTPEIVRQAAGKPAAEAAAILATALRDAEIRFAALAALPDRDVPFVAPRKAPAFVREQSGRPCAEVAETFAREFMAVHADASVIRAALERAGWRGIDDHRSIFRCAAWEILRKAQKPSTALGWIAEGISKLVGGGRGKNDDLWIDRSRDALSKSVAELAEYRDISKRSEPPSVSVETALRWSLAAAVAVVIRARSSGPCGAELLLDEYAIDLLLHTLRVEANAIATKAP